MNGDMIASLPIGLTLISIEHDPPSSVIYSDYPTILDAPRSESGAHSAGM